MDITKMESIFDLEALKARKKAASHLPKKKENKVTILKKEPKWFELPLTPDCFVKRTDKNGKVYAQHKEWKNTIWIGPYNNEDELNKVLKSYMAISKKSYLKKSSIENLHSIIMEETDW